MKVITKVLGVLVSVFTEWRPTDRGYWYSVNENGNIETVMYYRSNRSKLISM